MWKSIESGLFQSVSASSSSGLSSDIARLKLSCRLSRVRRRKVDAQLRNLGVVRSVPADDRALACRGDPISSGSCASCQRARSVPLMRTVGAEPVVRSASSSKFAIGVSSAAEYSLTNCTFGPSHARPDGGVRQKRPILVALVQYDFEKRAEHHIGNVALRSRVHDRNRDSTRVPTRCSGRCVPTRC